MSIPIIKGCPPIPGPWPVRCETTEGEVFVEMRATGQNSVFINPMIVTTIDRWGRGELVEVVEIRGRR